MLVFTVSSLTPGPARTSRMASRGVPNPHSTSGHTGTHSTKRPNVSVRNASRLWPPSKRTGSPSRHVEMPMRIGRRLESSTLPSEPQKGADARCDEREPRSERRPKSQMKAFGKCHGEEEGKAKRNEDKHLSSHPRNWGEVGRTQVHKGVYGEDHERHRQNHVGYARIPACDLADRNDDESCDDTVQNEFDHGGRHFSIITIDFAPRGAPVSAVRTLIRNVAQEGPMTRLNSAILSAFAFVGFGALLVAQAPPPRHPAANNPHLGNRESIRGGMAFYRVRCADCHALDGTGYRGPDLIAA